MIASALGAEHHPPTLRAAMSPQLIMEMVGFITGITGGLLVALRSQKMRFYGFAIWVISNLCWMGFAIYSQAWFMLAMFSMYLGTSLLGLKNNTKP